MWHFSGNLSVVYVGTLVQVLSISCVKLSRLFLRYQSSLRQQIFQAKAEHKYTQTKTNFRIRK